jgi:hypothetical protein
MIAPTFTHFSHVEMTAILDMAKERLTNSVAERKRIIQRNAKLGRSEDKRIVPLNEFITLYRNIAMKAMMSLEKMEEDTNAAR